MVNKNNTQVVISFEESEQRASIYTSEKNIINDVPSPSFVAIFYFTTMCFRPRENTVPFGFAEAHIYSALIDG